MIGLGSTLKILDNSGAKQVQCIRVLKGNNRTKAKLGDIIVASIKKISNIDTSKNKRKKVSKGQVHHILIIGCKKKSSRYDGSNIYFNSNNGVIIDNNGLPLSTRIFSPIPKEITKRKFSKIFSLAPYIV
jgi:large subunit ribosomal protein L14